MDINTDIFKIETNHVLPSRGKVLISEPFLYDEMFGRSIILLVDHTLDGTMGLVLNKSLPLYLNDVLKDFKDTKTRSHTDGFQRNNAKCLDEKGISRFVPHSSI